MKFRLFDITGSLPFSQGYAINEIAKQTTGKLVAAGENAESIDLAGGLLYIKKTYEVGEVTVSESIWHDDGCGVTCIYKRLNEKQWEKKHGEGDWRPDPFTVELSEPTGVLTA